MTDDKEARLQRLEDAIEAFVARDETVTDEQLLTSHAGLRDLLEPMLAPPLDEAGADASPTLRRIGELDVVREIGRGGMGIVYEATDRQLKRRVAVKIMGRALEAGTSALVRFRREAELAASLRHPAIVPVHSLGETGDEFFLVMELERAASLADVLDELRGSEPDEVDVVRYDAALAVAIDKRFPGTAVAVRSSQSDYVHAIVHALQQIADALGHAHDKAVIHRDVKPGNVLVDDRGRAYLTDFGLACVQDSPGVTQTGMQPGTPQYMAPEQIDDDRGALGPATDVFSLGATLYEALTLQRAFPGDTVPAVLYAVVHEQPADVRERNPSVPEDLAAIVRRCLQKDPRDRYPNARELALDLDAWLRGDAVSARAPTLGERAARRLRRHPGGVAIAILLALGLPLVLWLANAATQRESEAEKGKVVLQNEWLDQQLVHGFREAGEGDFDAAHHHFTAVLQRHPRAEEAIAGLSALARRRGDREALHVLEEHPEALQQSLALRRRRATLLARLADEQAAAAAEGLGDETADFDAFLSGYGRLELGHGGDKEQFATARQLLHRAVVTADHHRPLYYYEWLHAAAHDGHREDVDAAIAAIERLWPDDATGRFWVAFAREQLGDDDAAIAELEHAIELDGEFLNAANNLAMLLRRSGRPDRALQVLQRLPEAARSTREVRRQLAMTLVAMRQPDEAVRTLRAALTAKPTDTLLRRDLSTALAAAGDVTQAMEQLQVVVREYPQDASAWLSLGTMQLRAGQFEDARKSLESSIAAAATADAYFNLGLACARLNDPAGATAAYEQCLALAGEHVQTLVNLGILRLRGGDRDAAERLLRRAVAAEPTFVPARRSLLRALDDQPAEAVRMCRDWTDRSPEFAEAWRHLASSIVRQGDPDHIREALQFAEKADALTGGKDAPTRHCLGEALLANGQAERAREVVQQAIDLLDPNDRFASYYREQFAATLTACQRALDRAPR